MRALIEALDTPNQFESSAAPSTAGFKLATLLSPLAGDASLNGDNNALKSTIIMVVIVATTYILIT